MKGDRVFYSLPKSQLKLINLLFNSLQDGSALNLQLIQGELAVTSQVAINWGDLNLPELIKMLSVVRAGNQTWKLIIPNHQFDLRGLINDGAISG